MIKKLLNRLPENIVKTVEIWKSRYHDERFNKEATRAEIRGYLKGLFDADILHSDNEYRLLFVYMTL